MSYIDTQIPYASGDITGTVAGAPQGGGTLMANAAVTGSPRGMHGPGGSGQIGHWVLVFYAFIAIVLVTTGVLFNGKGR